MTHARCPQNWAVFKVKGETGFYDVVADDPVRGTFRCSCKAWIFSGSPRTCKHVALILRHGCFSGGPNDLGSVGVQITGVNPMRATRSTRRQCACGERQLEPKVRTKDEHGRQVVQVQPFGATMSYTYASGRRLAVGDLVGGGVVTQIGSDYAGPLKVIGSAA